MQTVTVSNIQNFIKAGYFYERKKFIFEERLPSLLKSKTWPTNYQVAGIKKTNAIWRHRDSNSKRSEYPVSLYILRYIQSFRES